MGMLSWIRTEMRRVKIVKFQEKILTPSDRILTWLNNRLWFSNVSSSSGHSWSLLPKPTRNRIMALTQTYHDPDIWCVQALERNGYLKLKKTNPPWTQDIMLSIMPTMRIQPWRKLGEVIFLHTFGARVADLCKIRGISLNDISVNV